MLAAMTAAPFLGFVVVVVICCDASGLVVGSA